MKPFSGQQVIFTQREAESEITALRARVVELQAERSTAFVSGARWWEYVKSNAIMWPADVRIAEAEAKRRWPGCWDAALAGREDL